MLVARWLFRLTWKLPPPQGTLWAMPPLNVPVPLVTPDPMVPPVMVLVEGLVIDWDWMVDVRLG